MNSQEYFHVEIEVRRAFERENQDERSKPLGVKRVYS
jgi:hypothetical protein